MEQVIYTVKLDLTDNGCFDSGWRIKQGDNANSHLKVKVENNGVVYFNPLNLPEIVFHRPDGSTVVSVMSAGTDDFYTYTIVGNELAVAGNVVMDVKFTDSGRTSTASCTFLCVPDTISGDPSGASTYYNPISELIEQGEQIVDETDDNRLISEGYARGTQDGEEVGPGSPYYHNNAKYYMEQSSEVSNITWDRVQNKPFISVGNNLTVDQNGALNASPGLTNLSELYDVDINGPANGQVLAYNASTQKWINSSSGGGGGLLPHLIVTTTTGSTVTATKGLTVVTLTETSTGQFEADIPEFGSWDIEASLSGSTATYTLTVDTVKIYTVSLGYFNATITVTFPANSTCSCGKTGETPQTASVSPHTFTVHSVGIYTITATDGTHTKSDTVTITTDSQSESVTLTYVPDGSTVTPTDDIQIWLNCADIYDKTSYTTLSDVLADSTTLSALIADNNAVDYMVRSKSWSGIKVPKMTDNTHPSGECFGSTAQGSNTFYKAFDGDDSSTFWQATSSDSFDTCHIGYEFENPICVKRVTMTTTAYNDTSTRITSFQLQGSNDGSTWVDIGGVITRPSSATTLTTNTDYATNTASYKKHRVRILSGVTMAAISIHTLQFSSDDLCADSAAMSFIGLNNYCANTLTADVDWNTAIQNSAYFESVDNAKAPTMTSNNTPSGLAFASSEYDSSTRAYRAFDGVTTSSNEWASSSNDNVGGYIGYIFTNPMSIKKLRLFNYNDSYSAGNIINGFKLQGSDDTTTGADGTWTDIGTEQSAVAGDNYFTYNNNTNYKGLRVYCTRVTSPVNIKNLNILEVQFYGRIDV